MPEPSQPGVIPASAALAEANPNSLAETISRFDAAVQAGSHASPEARRDLDKIVAALREQRVRWEAAEADKPQRGRGTSAKVPLGRKISASLDDLGL